MDTPIRCYSFINNNMPSDIWQVANPRQVQQRSDRLWININSSKLLVLSINTIINNNSNSNSNNNNNSNNNSSTVANWCKLMQLWLWPHSCRLHTTWFGLISLVVCASQSHDLGAGPEIVADNASSFGHQAPDLFPNANLKSICSHVYTEHHAYIGKTCRDFFLLIQLKSVALG